MGWRVIGGEGRENSSDGDRFGEVIGDGGYFEEEWGWWGGE